jgi:phage terminase large subunit-like protein
LSWLLASDWAVTKKEHGSNPDFTEHVLAGVGSEDASDLPLIYLDDGSSHQAGAEDTIGAWVRHVLSRHPHTAIMEKGVIKNALEPYLEREIEANALPITLDFLPTTADKSTMAAAFRMLARKGRVRVKVGEWGDRLIEQLCAFPFATKDDKVDACGLLGRYINQWYAPAQASPAVRPQGARKLTFSLLEQASLEDEDEARRRRGYMA